jgi:ribosomal protein S18 acetylase RimI-like enzyme
LAGLEAEIGTVLTARGLRGPRRPAGPWETRALRTPDDWRQAAQLRGLLDAEDGPVPAGHERFLERVTEEARGTVEAGHASYFGAFTDGALCSMVGIVSDGGGVARFQTVGTHPAHRRQGMACTLLVRAARFATAGLGADTLVIVADPDGPAVGLYRSLGFSDAELHFELSRTPARSPAD